MGYGIFINRVMRKIKVPFKGKGREFSYRVETININNDALPFLNVYTVNVEYDELRPMLGEQFTILYNQLNHPTPVFSVRSEAGIEEKNLKKQVAQQIINNPTE